MLKKDKPRSAGESSTISTLLGPDTTIEGTLTFQETIRVDGRIRGKLSSTGGTVIVGEKAVIDADVLVAVAIVRGQINGRVEATQRIEIYPPAKINGDICAPTVAIDSGVVFNGTCKMNAASGSVAKAKQTVPDKETESVATGEKNTKNL
jgi:cytoskeletal protein CcmA (bactofilin family)